MLTKQYKRYVMNKGSTLLLQAVVVLLGALVLGVLVLVLPGVIMAELSGDFDYAPLLFAQYITAIPFFYALFQTIKLLGLIEMKKAFSDASVQALKHIKWSGLIISGMYAAGMPYIFYLAEIDDAPGLAALGFVIIGASFVVATAAAVFQNLLQSAVELQSENDLTV